MLREVNPKVWPDSFHHPQIALRTSKLLTPKSKSEKMLETEMAKKQHPRAQAVSLSPQGGKVQRAGRLEYEHSLCPRANNRYSVKMSGPDWRLDAGTG